MIRQFQAFSLAVVVLVFGFISVSYAHGSQKEHDNDLFAVLFGDGYNLASDKKPAFQAVADAAALCLDQFSVNETQRSKEALFKELKAREGFSMSFDDIELLNRKNGMIVSAKTHRHYTHRGWNYTFLVGSQENPSNDDQSILKSEQDLWLQRKKILTATVNKELFGKSSGFLGNFHLLEGRLYSEDACSDQCDAFCCLVYNVHILGDYIEANSYSNEFSQLIPLVRHEDRENPTMMGDLITCFPHLFLMQKGSCKALISELEALQEETENLPYIKEEKRTQEEFDKYRDCAIKLYQKLVDTVPYLLRNEAFFSNVFYK